MNKKNEYNYFDAFTDLSNYSYQIAVYVHDTLSNFNLRHISQKVKEVHQIEHSADLAKHAIMNRLVKEFLPPIEREDIISLIHQLDRVTDSVEHVLISFDMYQVKSIRLDVLKLTELIVTCCKALNELLIEFKNFKYSKILQNKIIGINHLEEQGNTLYVTTVRNLYQTSKDPIELMGWTEVLRLIEKCYNNCEDVANLIERIVMKNS